MTQQLALSGPQADLILELLEAEQKELLVQIRHTDNAAFRAGLKGRLTMVESLIHQTEELAHAAQAGTRSSARLHTSG